MEETISAPSQGATGDIHPSSTYKSQLLQMFADMKEEMTKQQTLFDREREQAAHDRENTAREQKELKHLNDQLLAQIIALQNTQGPPPSPERPTATEAQNDEHSQCRR